MTQLQSGQKLQSSGERAFCELLPVHSILQRTNIIYKYTLAYKEEHNKNTMSHTAKIP